MRQKTLPGTALAVSEVCLGTMTWGEQNTQDEGFAQMDLAVERGLNFLLGQLGFDAQSSVAMGTGYLEDLGFPDSRIFPDLSTYVVLPWADKTARVLCEPRFQDGRPAMAAPRAVARAMLAELATLGYGFFSGFEYECYFVDRETREPPFPGIGEKLKIIPSHCCTTVNLHRRCFAIRNEIVEDILEIDAF